MKRLLLQASLAAEDHAAEDAADQAPAKPQKYHAEQPAHDAAASDVAAWLLLRVVRDPVAAVERTSLQRYQT